MPAAGTRSTPTRAIPQRPELSSFQILSADRGPLGSLGYSPALSAICRHNGYKDDSWLRQNPAGHDQNYAPVGNGPRTGMTPETGPLCHPTSYPDRGAVA
jgi:hypothetical protein